MNNLRSTASERSWSRTTSSIRQSLVPDAPLEELGIDSLGVAELLFNVEDEFKVTMPPEPVDAGNRRRRGGLHRRPRRHATGRCGPGQCGCRRRSAGPLRRVAVTGIGVVSPLGNGAAEVLANARAGRSGIHRLDAPFAQRLTGARWRPRRRSMARSISSRRSCACWIGSASSRWSRPTRRWSIAGRPGAGRPQPRRRLRRHRHGRLPISDDGYQTLYGDNSDRIKPFTVLMGMHNAPAAWIGIEHDLRGPNLTYSTACSSSAVAIGEAWLRVARGDLDMAIAGGAEAPLSFGSLKAWEALHTLATIDEDDPSASCKPFSKNRSGMVLGEGAAMMVLEALGARRGARRADSRRDPRLRLRRPTPATSRGPASKARPRRCGCAAFGGHRCRRRSTPSTRTAPARRRTMASKPARHQSGLRRACRAHPDQRDQGACTVTCWAPPARSNACCRCWRCSSRSPCRPCTCMRPIPTCDLDYVPNRVREGVTVHDHAVEFVCVRRHQCGAGAAGRAVVRK